MLQSPDPRLLVFNAGKRLRRLAGSKEWSSAEMRPLRRLFEDFAFRHPTDTGLLRQVIESVGSRELDGRALAELSADHVPLLWRGYYGGAAADLHEAGSTRQ